MNNIKNNIKKSFSMIPNALILDSGLSDRARFVFCLLASKPDDWVFFNKSLAKELGYSVETLRKYISELKDFRWIEVINEDFKPNSYVLKSNNSTVSGKVRHGKSPTREKSDTYKEVLKDISNFNKEVLKEGNPVRKPRLSPLSNLWNEICFDLPKVIQSTKGRLAKERLRLRQRPFTEWGDVFNKISMSKFCLGDNKRGWIASFDWIISNDENALKVLEGRYGGGGINSPKMTRMEQQAEDLKEAFRK